MIGISFLNADIEKVSEKCNRHNVHKQKFKGRNMTPICPLCQREKIEKEDKKRVSEELKKAERFETYGWLNRLSLITDDTIKKASFQTSNVVTDGEQRQNFKNGYQVAKDYLSGATYNTLLVGKPGTGKSHLAMSILKEVNEKSNPYRKCLFISVDEMMRQIKDSFNNMGSKWTEAMLVEKAIKADLIVLDDLGAEIGLLNNNSKSSDFVGRVLTSVLNGRQNKPTIITSNLKYSDIERKYDDRIKSRLKIGKHTIQFVETEDQRGK